VTRDRGRVDRPDLASFVVATIHPSAVLRARNAVSREALLGELVADLRLIAEADCASE
jgi:hypothetical protein